MQTAFFLIITILANAFANIFLKIGADRLPPLISGNIAANALAFVKSPWIILGALLFITNFPLYNVVLQRMKLAIAFPVITTSAFALTIIISILFLKESLTAQQFVGLLLLAVALWLVASGR